MSLFIQELSWCIQRGGAIALCPPHDWREAAARMSSGARSQEIVPKSNERFSVVSCPGVNNYYPTSFAVQFINLLFSARINCKPCGRNKIINLTT